MPFTFRFRAGNLLVLFFVSYLSAVSQPQLMWDVRYSTHSDIVGSYDLQFENNPTLKFDQDHNLIMGSIQLNDGQRDYVFLKYNTDGELLWDFVFDGAAHLADYARDFVIDPDNNVIITGETHTKYIFDFDQSYGESDLFVSKLSADGEPLWTYFRSGIEFSLNTGKSITLDDEQNIYVTGRSLSPDYNRTLCVIKLDAQGNLLWEHVVPDIRALQAKVVNGQLHVVGGGIGLHIELLQYTASGDLLQHVSIPDLGISAIPVIDEEGNVYVKRGTSVYQVTKISPQGEVLWTFAEPKLLPPNVHADELNSIDFDEEMNLYVTGRHYGEHYGNDSLYKNGDILTLKLSPDGEEIWRNRYEHEGGNTAEIGAHLVRLANGHLLITGAHYTGQNGDVDALLYLLDSLGQQVWVDVTDGGWQMRDYNVHSLIDGNFFYTMGWNEDAESMVSVSVKKYAFNFPVGLQEEMVDEMGVHLFPNPTSRILNIVFPGEQQLDFKFEIVDQTGSVMLRQQMQRGHQITLPEHMTSGWYILKLKRDGQLLVRPFYLSR